MSDFEVVRTISIDAPPGTVHALVNDFHEWEKWSPWEGIDPDQKTTYSGADSGVGAAYAWEGNRKVGQGSMEIIGSTPERVDVDLHFLKPFKANNLVDITMTPSGSGTDVVYRMTGTHKGFAKIMFKVMSMDKMVGPDFEKGLAQLKAAAEGK